MVIVTRVGTVRVHSKQLLFEKVSPTYKDGWGEAARERRRRGRGWQIGLCLLRYTATTLTTVRYSSGIHLASLLSLLTWDLMLRRPTLPHQTKIFFAIKKGAPVKVNCSLVRTQRSTYVVQQSVQFVWLGFHFIFHFHLLLPLLLSPPYKQTFWQPSPFCIFPFFSSQHSFMFNISNEK